MIKKSKLIEFEVPPELRESDVINVKRIAIDGESFIIEHDNKTKVVNPENPYDEIKFSIFGERDEDLEQLKICARRNFLFVANADAIIEKLVRCVSAIYSSDRCAKVIAKIKHRAKLEVQKEQQKEEDGIKKLYIQKYYDKEAEILYEAVLVAGKAHFISWDWNVQSAQPLAKLYVKILLPDASSPEMELLPLERSMYLNKPFEFASEDELNKYLKLATAETLDSLFETQYGLGSKYIDANKTHLTMLAADDIFTFFQDKLGQTHYLIFVGDNDTGKTANLVYFKYEGYRAMLDVDMTSANIYGFLGNFEEGQGIILEDEADDIHKKPEKMKYTKQDIMPARR